MDLSDLTKFSLIDTTEEPTPFAEKVLITVLGLSAMLIPTVLALI